MLIEGEDAQGIIQWSKPSGGSFNIPTILVKKHNREIYNLGIRIIQKKQSGGMFKNLFLSKQGNKKIPKKGLNFFLKGSTVIFEHKLFFLIKKYFSKVFF